MRLRETSDPKWPGQIAGAPSVRIITVGLISDTHGLLRPQAVDALRGSDFIVHSGDVGDPQILEDLSRLAPVTAVRGNVDTGAWASSLPDTAVLEVGGVFIFVIHNLADLDLDPAAAGFQAVVSGHSHQPGCREKDGVLFVNPGSAGPRRFRLPIVLGRLLVAGTRVTTELIELAP
jgi:putative phosphoesterase